MSSSIHPVGDIVNSTLLAELVCFGILFAFCYRSLWPRWISLLDERRARIEQGLTQADQAEVALSEAESTAKATLARAQTDAGTIRQEARAEADRSLKQAESKALQERDQVLSRARAEIAAEVEQAQQKLEAEAIELALKVAQEWLKAQKHWSPEALEHEEAQRMLKGLKGMA